MEQERLVVCDHRDKGNCQPACWHHKAHKPTDIGKHTCEHPGKCPDLRQTCRCISLEEDYSR